MNDHLEASKPDGIFFRMWVETEVPDTKHAQTQIQTHARQDRKSSCTVTLLICAVIT